MTRVQDLGHALPGRLRMVTALGPRKLLPRRPAEPPVREPRVRLVRRRCLALDAGVVRACGLRDRIEERASFKARACHEDDARLVAGADERVTRTGRAVDEVPR